MTVREFIDKSWCDFHAYIAKKDGNVLCETSGYEELLFACGGRDILGWSVESPTGYADELTLVVTV